VEICGPGRWSITVNEAGAQRVRRRRIIVFIFERAQYEDNKDEDVQEDIAADGSGIGASVAHNDVDKERKGGWVDHPVLFLRCRFDGDRGKHVQHFVCCKLPSQLACVFRMQ
jgi:hypothetical protein